jgi:hypothetical protein
MRTLNTVGALCLAGALVVVGQAPASSTPVTTLSAAIWLETAPVATHARVRGHQRYVGGWRRWGGVAVPHGWYDADDDACSGDHPPWAGEYAGYPDFWCSPGFGRYYRHWPQF